jgi:exodeoxyribonuclease III
MSDSARPNDSMPLRVMTYNILDGGEGREEYLFEVLQAVQPDVAILQEVYRADFAQNLASALKMESFFAGGNRKRRVGLLSRLPIIAGQSYHRFPPIWRNVVEAEIEYQPGKKLWLFGIHPVANLSVLCECWRWWEAKRIIERAKRHAAEPCLVAGDFNAIAPHDRVVTNRMPRWLKFTILVQGNRVYHFSVHQYLSAGLTDCFRSLHPDDDGFTLPPPKPNSRLDYILVNDALKQNLIKCWVVREPPVLLKASDHYPVVAEFRI